MKTTIVTLNPHRPNSEQLKQIADQLSAGKLVAFPTETVYGIAACATNKEAVEKLHNIKERPLDKPFSYHIGDWNALEQLHVIQSRVFKYFSDLFWPGPVTLVALDRKDLKIGIRFPSHHVAAGFLKYTKEPVIASSANKSGGKSPVTAEEVLNAFPNELDIVIDAGKSDFQGDSTVVDVVSFPPVILRRGVLADKVEEAIHKVQVGKFTRKRILMVCTGNTCRSPLAEGWLKSELARHRLLDEISVKSCGINAIEGREASMESILCLKNDEIDLSSFRSRQCRKEEALASDLIFVMSKEHREFLIDQFPETHDKIVVLDIMDPIGMSLTHYQQCYDSIKNKLKKSWPEIIK